MTIADISDLSLKTRRQRTRMVSAWLGRSTSWRTLSPGRRVEARHIVDVFASNAARHEQEARAGFTVIALIFGLAAFAVATLTYFATLVPSSQVSFDSAANSVVTSTTDPSSMLDLGVWIAMGAATVSIAAAAQSSVHGLLAASDRKIERKVGRLLFVDERFHATAEVPGQRALVETGRA